MTLKRKLKRMREAKAAMEKEAELHANGVGIGTTTGEKTAPTSAPECNQ